MLQPQDFIKIKDYLDKQKTSNPLAFKNANRWLQINQATKEFNNASSAIITQFIDLCFRHNLNPIQNDIYLLTMGFGRPPQIFIGYDALYRIALNSNKIEYWTVNEIWDSQDPTQLIRVDVTVKRKDQELPTTLSYLMNEWKKNTKGPWETMPAFMLRKCAIARTFSLLFQDVFSDLSYYTDAEIWNNEQNTNIETIRTLNQKEQAQVSTTDNKGIEHEQH